MSRNQKPDFKHSIIRCKYGEGITGRSKDKNVFSRGKILFLRREEKNHIFKPPLNFTLLAN